MHTPYALTEVRGNLCNLVLILCEFNKTISNTFQICHILWYFQDGCHWPLGLFMGTKLKHAPISLKIMSNCLSCHKDSKKVLFDASPMLSFNTYVVEGVPMDPKISFHASAQKLRISWRCRFLTFIWEKSAGKILEWIKHPPPLLFFFFFFLNASLYLFLTQNNHK